MGHDVDAHGVVAIAIVVGMQGKLWSGPVSRRYPVLVLMQFPIPSSEILLTGPDDAAIEKEQNTATQLTKPQVPTRIGTVVSAWLVVAIVVALNGVLIVLTHHGGLIPAARAGRGVVRPAHAATGSATRCPDRPAWSAAAGG